MKVCRACDENKLLGEFWNNKGRKDGKDSYCIPCRSSMNKKWSNDNKEWKRKYGREYNKKVKHEVIEAYGGECACCGEDKIEFMSIDHIDGGRHGKISGRQLRKSGEHGGVGRHLYTWLRQQKYPEGFRVLCHNCNQSKGMFGYCPHEKTKS
jgi:hypothetical protein